MKAKRKKASRYQPAGMQKPIIDPAVAEVADILSRMTPTEISKHSWVSKSAVYNFFSGKTKKPQNLTVAGMLHAAGYGRKIVKL